MDFLKKAFMTENMDALILFENWNKISNIINQIKAAISRELNIRLNFSNKIIGGY